MKKSKRDDLKDSGFLVVNARGRRKKEREKEEGGDKKNYKGA